MDIKLICLDLDGTLLGPGGRVSPGNRAAIARARAAGVHVAIATGRLYEAARHFARAAGADEVVISSNGGEIAGADRARPVSLTRMPDALCRGATVLAWRLGLSFQVISQRGMFALSDRPVRFIREHEGSQAAWRRTDETCCFELPTLTHLFRAVRGAALKLLAFEGAPGSLAALRAALADRTDLALESSWADNVEIMPAGVNKGAGVALLARHYGLGPEQVMAVGDNENDQTMFAWAGCPVAMGNAIGPIRDMARLVAPDNLHDGVAWAIDRALEGGL